MQMNDVNLHSDAFSPLHESDLIFRKLKLIAPYFKDLDSEVWDPIIDEFLSDLMFNKSVGLKKIVYDYLLSQDEISKYLSRLIFPARGEVLPSEDDQALSNQLPHHLVGFENSEHLIEEIEKNRGTYFKAILVDERAGSYELLQRYLKKNKIRRRKKGVYKLTLIVSLFHGAKYLPSFIENLRQSTLFKYTNILIFDAGKNLFDLGVLHDSLTKFKNIKYFKLKTDPGLYEIWNLGIHLSTTDLVGNANIDDRRHPFQIELVLDKFDSNKDISLVSTHIVPFMDLNKDVFSLVKDAPHVYYEWMQGRYDINDLFVKTDNGYYESHCIPHCMPIWRKSLHERVGYFNEAVHKSAADFELWLRAINEGLHFYLLPEPLSYYYVNPDSYMRVDASHSTAGQNLYESFIKNTRPKSRKYNPDFNKLKSNIEFEIN